MKSQVPMPKVQVGMLLLCSLCLLLFHSVTSQAQTYKTATMSLPFTTLTLGSASNTVAIANASGYANATPYELKTASSPAPQ